MRILPFVFIFIFTMTNGSCQSKQEISYDPANYYEESRGLLDRYHTIVFRNKYNANASIKKVYSDSLFNDSCFFVIQYSYYGNQLDGPCETHFEGQLSTKGFYKKSKKHGEFISYDINGVIECKEHYNMGKKVGTWEYYNSNNILHKKVFFDANGKFIKRELYNQKTGKLARTEYKEEAAY